MQASCGALGAYVLGVQACLRDYRLGVLAWLSARVLDKLLSVITWLDTLRACVITCSMSLRGHIFYMFVLLKLVYLISLLVY